MPKQKHNVLERVFAVELNPRSAPGGKPVVVQGWVQEVRDLGNLKFVILKDKTGFVQLTLPKKAVPENVFKAVPLLTKETAVRASGIVQKAPQAMNGVEVIPSSLHTFSLSKAPVPLDTSGKIESDLSVRLDYRFLDLRNPKSQALFKIKSSMQKAVVDFFDREGFTGIHTPKLTIAGVESGAELFTVDYFGKPAFLSQSPQIYKQMMVLAGFEKVYEIGSVFRAEKSHTTRHVTEFIGVDFEMGFIESFEEPMNVAEGLVKFIVSYLQKNCKPELALFNCKPLVPKSIPRVALEDAKEWLKKEGKVIPINEDPDAEAEKLLGKIAREKFKSDWIFITHYPYAKRPFYHMKPEGHPESTLSFDLLWNGVEVGTGAQREHRYDILKAQAKEKGLNLDKMEDYARIFQYGSIPHGGMGLGLDRMVETLLQLPTIKEAILLPRDPERLRP